MYELIKIENTTIGSETVPTVNARKLYEFLGSQRQFSDWIKKLIQDYGFAENKDFSIISQKSETIDKRGRAKASLRYEYFLTIDMAKEICMIQKNDKGKQARTYFIECEKKLQTRLIPQTFSQALRAYADELEAHEATRVALTHKKEVAKLENGKSIYGASVRQMSLKTGHSYNAKRLARWCKVNDRPALVIHPNGYSSAKVSVYPTEAWREIYDIDLLAYFEEDEISY